MHYFGRHHDAPVYDNGTWEPTPVGVPCMWCHAPVVEGDDGFLMDAMGADQTWKRLPGHRDCFLRTILGPKWPDLSWLTSPPGSDGGASGS